MASTESMSQITSILIGLILFHFLEKNIFTHYNKYMYVCWRLEKNILVITFPLRQEKPYHIKLLL